MQLIDADTFNSIYECFDGDIVETFEIFFQETKKKLVEIEEAIGSGNFREMRRLAHAVKGSALNFSASALAALAFKIEKSPSLEEARGLLPDLRPLYIQSQRALEALLH